MGGRIIFEVLNCTNAPTKSLKGFNKFRKSPEIARQSGQFVRININDGIIALPGCQSGPGGSCALDDFLVHVEGRGENLKGLGEICEVKTDVEADEGRADEGKGMSDKIGHVDGHGYGYGRRDIEGNAPPQMSEEDVGISDSAMIWVVLAIALVVVVVFVTFVCWWFDLGRHPKIILGRYY